MLSRTNLDKLRQQFLDATKISYDTANISSKLTELKQYNSLFEDKYYIDNIFKPSKDIKTLEDLEIGVEFVESREQHDLWDTFRAKTSSIATNKNLGRHVRILVKDRNSNKYLGIIALGSDVNNISDRDKLIGWTKEQKLSGKKLNYIMNITCCVGLQPISYNYNIGKLLVAICYSQEVHDYLESKYGHGIACITTFSINGKSIQYDRMKPYLELIGYTKGYGSVQISDDLYRSSIQLLKSINDMPTNLHQKSKLGVCRKVIRFLDLPESLLNHGNPRGIYIGFTGKNCKEFLRDEATEFGKENIKPLSDIVQWWKQRWAFGRFNHLKKENNLLTKIKFLNYKTITTVAKTQKYNEKKKEELGDDEFKKKKRDYMKVYREKDKLKDKKDKESINEPTLLDPEYIAGLFDGDGGIDRIDTSTVLISNCDPDVLVKIHDQFGGSIRRRVYGENSNKRDIYLYNIYGQQSLKILHYIKDHLIIEYDKVSLYIKGIETLDPAEKMILLNRACQYDKSGNPIKPYSRMNMKYLAGFFDAEGCICARSKGNSVGYTLTITQQEDTLLLDQIKQFIGYGKVDSKRYSLHDSHEIYRVFKAIQPYSIVKSRQISYTLECMDSTDTDRKQQLVEMIANDKHINHIIDVEEYKQIKKTKTKKNIPDHQKKLLSERMTGENNPNFGKEREDTHCKNIALAHAMSEKMRNRRALTDEQIEEVKIRYAQGETNKTKLAESMNCNRETVRKILDGKMKTLAEAREELHTGEIKICKSIKDPPKEKSKQFDDVFKLKLIKYVYNTKDITFKQVEERSKELFGEKVKITSFRNWIYGRYLIKESKFPLSDIDYQTYLSYIRTKAE